MKIYVRKCRYIGHGKNEKYIGNEDILDMEKMRKNKWQYKYFRLWKKERNMLENVDIFDMGKLKKYMRKCRYA